MIPIKSGKEIDKMRLACRTASEILDRLSELVRPGISTKEVDQAAADFMHEAGVRSAFLGYNFPPSPAEPRPFLEAFRQWKRPWLCRTAKCGARYSNSDDGHLL